MRDGVPCCIAEMVLKSGFIGAAQSPKSVSEKRTSGAKRGHLVWNGANGKAPLKAHAYAQTLQTPRPKEGDHSCTVTTVQV